MERPNYKLQALIYYCKSILELYDRSLCTQRFHRFANKRNVEHNLWWLSDWVAIRLTRYVVTRETEKKYTAKIKSGKWGFTWMLSLYDYIYKKNSLSKREEHQVKTQLHFNFNKWIRASVSLSTDILNFFVPKLFS